MPSASPEYEVLVGPVTNGNYYLGPTETGVSYRENSGDYPTLVFFGRKEHVRGILNALQRAVVENPDVFNHPTELEMATANNPFLAPPLIFDEGINIAPDQGSDLNDSPE